MTPQKNAWLDADKLLSQSHPDQVLTHYGLPIPEKKTGNNYRLECPLPDCDSEKSSYGQFSIELNPPYRIHCFSCGIRGNLFDLMYIAKHGRRPSGNKLRGPEFKEVLDDLAAIVDGDRDLQSAHSPPPARQKTEPKRERPEPNVPLHLSDNERTRELVDLWQQGVTDPAKMTPAASSYFRSRNWLTQELCENWGIGYLPNDSKGTLRGRFVYRIDNVVGQALAYAGRDPDYDAKHALWLRKKKGVEPMKLRFPSEKFFRKGLELYGQQARRLSEPGYREAVAQTGVVCVEGFNDVLSLEAKGQPAVGAMSNRLTNDQVEKLIRFAHEVGGHKVTLMFDRNDAGQDGQKDAMAKLAGHVPVLDGLIVPHIFFVQDFRRACPGRDQQLSGYTEIS